MNDIRNKYKVSKRKVSTYLIIPTRKEIYPNMKCQKEKKEGSKYKQQGMKSIQIRSFRS